MEKSPAKKHRKQREQGLEGTTPPTLRLLPVSVRHCVILSLPPAENSLWKSSEKAAPPQKVPSALDPWASSSQNRTSPSFSPAVATFSQLQTLPIKQLPSDIPSVRQSLQVTNKQALGSGERWGRRG